MKTVFTCKPSTLSEVSSIGGQNQNNGRDMSEYYVAAEKHLTAAEWCCFTDTLLNDRAWIAEFSAQKHLPDNGATPCLRVTGDGSEIVLLIDPSGYSYARYVGIERAAESSAAGTPTVAGTPSAKADYIAARVAEVKASMEQAAIINAAIVKALKSSDAAHQAYAAMSKVCAETEEREKVSTEAEMQPYWAKDSAAFQSSDDAAQAARQAGMEVAAFVMHPGFGLDAASAAIKAFQAAIEWES